MGESVHCTVYFIWYSEKPFVSSLRDVPHDGWLFIYYATAAVNFSAHSWAASVRATGTVRKGRRYGPYKITTAGSLSQPTRQAAVLGHPSSLRPHQSNEPDCKQTSTPSFFPLCNSGASVLCVHNSPWVNLHKPVTL